MAVSGQARAVLSQLSESFRNEFAPEEVLGEGAMGVVVAARQQQLGRKVAIKLLLCFSDSEALSRFQREAHISGQLDHPRIVRLFTSGVDGQMPYLVYEFVPGRTLKDRLFRDGPLAAPAALKLGEQLLDGLAHAHGQSVMHRDLKPANLLVTEDEELKIADYGIGSSLTVEWALTRTGTLMGTPAYMAPEQWESRTSLAVDVYAAGLVMHEMLTGANPFQRGTMMGTRTAHMTDARPRLPPGADPRIDELLDAMCAKAAEARPDAAEALERLREIRRRPRSRTRSGVHSRPSRTPLSSAPAASGDATPIARSTGALTGALGGRGGLTLGIALVIFSAGIFAYLHTRAALTGASAVPGAHSAVLFIETDRAATPGARLDPGPPDLKLVARDRDGQGRRWTLALSGLEPGVAYRVQPLVDGRPAGPVLPLTTCGRSEQLASVMALTFTDAHTLRVRFRSACTLPAALSVSTAMPADWTGGTATAPREVSITGLDPARTYQPEIQFDGLPETVSLGPVPGAGRLVEAAHGPLAGAMGGPSFADRAQLVRRLIARAQKRAVSPDRAREELERHVRAVTGAPVELVLTAAAARAGDETLALADRWRAAEVLDGLTVLEVLAHPWCGAWVFDVAGRRPRFPVVDLSAALTRPAGAPPLSRWAAPGPARAYIAQECLPLWTQRDRPKDGYITDLASIDRSQAVEEQLSVHPGWAFLTPPNPFGRGADVTLVLKVFNLLEDQVLWLRLGGERTLAVPAPRGAKPASRVDLSDRVDRAITVTVHVPGELAARGHGLEVRLDGFQAATNAPIADEAWLSDGWVEPAAR